MATSVVISAVVISVSYRKGFDLKPMMCASKLQEHSVSAPACTSRAILPTIPRLLACLFSPTRHGHINPARPGRDSGMLWTLVLTFLDSPFMTPRSGIPKRTAELHRCSVWCCEGGKWVACGTGRHHAIGVCTDVMSSCPKSTTTSGHNTSRAAGLSSTVFQRRHTCAPCRVEPGRYATAIQ